MKRNDACMKKQRTDGYYVLVRSYVPSGEYHLEPKYIKDVLSTKCRSDMDIHKTGPCNGCQYPQDTDYLKEQGLL